MPQARKKIVTPASKFESGLKLSKSLVGTWNKTGKTTFVAGDTRIHHGFLGTIFAIIGTVTKSPGITGLGVGLMTDDIQDITNWFRFV